MTVGRLLTCTGPCGAVVDVLEASDTGEHQWIDADQYVCGTCLEAQAATLTSFAAAAAQVAQAKATSDAIPYMPEV